MCVSIFEIHGEGHFLRNLTWERISNPLDEMENSPKFGENIKESSSGMSLKRYIGLMQIYDDLGLVYPSKVVKKWGQKSMFDEARR